MQLKINSKCLGYLEIILFFFLKIKYIMSFGRLNCKKKNTLVKIDKITDKTLLLYKLRNLYKLLNSSVLKYPDLRKINPFFENNLVRFSLLK